MMKVDFPVVGLIVFAFLCFVGIKLLARRRPKTSSEPRSTSWRVIAGFLGAGLLVAVITGTLSDVEQVYAVQPNDVFVKVPTLGEAELKRDPSDRFDQEIEHPFRVLVDFVMFDESYGSEGLIHVEQMEFTHTKGSTQTKTVALPSVAMHVTITLANPTLRMDHNKSAYINGRVNIKAQFLNSNSTSGQGGSIRNGSRVMSADVRHFNGVRSAFSLCNSVSAPNFRVYLFTTPIETDDPLKTIDGMSYVNRIRPDLLRRPENERIQHYPGRSILPVLGLIGWAETASITFLIAAVLLAQAFPHRTASFACALMLVIGVAAILDRTSLQSHVDQLQGEDSSARERGLAADHLSESFFFRETAERELRAAIERHEDQPLLLRSFAQAMEKLKHFRHP